MCRTAAFTVTLCVLACGVLRGPAQGPLQDYTKTDPEKLGVKPVPPKKDPITGFVVGGKNPTALIRKLMEIAGRRIADLEKAMRPGQLAGEGFLGNKEKLLDVMAADNAYVVDEQGLTHQELARHLHVFGAIAIKQATGQPKKFAYHGRTYKVKAALFRGYQDSPFKDGTKTNCETTVWNLSNGKKLKYSLLVPHMIERYGFYEGKGRPIAWSLGPSWRFSIFSRRRRAANS
jgi:hypothetical protein